MRISETQQTTATAPRRIAASLTLMGLVGIVLFTVLAMRHGRAEAAGGPCNPSGGLSAQGQTLFGEVNAWRASQFGVPPAQMSAPANLAAQWFAEQMAAGKTSSHTDSFGRTWAERLVDCGYDNYWAYGSGEALALGSTAQDAITSMTANSQYHQNVVQAPVDWQCGGVGQSGTAWVVVLAQYGSTQCPQAVTGGGGGGDTGSSPSPSASVSSTPTQTPTATATATPTRTPTPTTTPSANYNRQITIYSGWNLVTLPAGSLNDVLDTARGCFSAVYEMQNGTWHRYIPGAPAFASNLTASDGGAFWILGSDANCGIVTL